MVTPTTIDDIRAPTRAALQTTRAQGVITSVQRVAIAVGIRGIVRLPRIVATVVAALSALGAEQFVVRATEKIRRCLEVTQGRAFCLSTSYAQMNGIYERLLGELGYPMLLQVSAPKSALLQEFRSTPNAVLFATS